MTFETSQKDEPNTVADFMSRWRMEVGDDFGSAVDLETLKVSGYSVVMRVEI